MDHSGAVSSSTSARASSVPEPPKPSQRQRWQSLFAWFLGLCLLGWMFRSIPFTELLAAIQRASVPLLVLFLCVFVAAVLLFDTLATWFTFRRVLPEFVIPRWEVLKIRAATYLLVLVNYTVGQGGVAYFLNRRHKVPLARSAGSVLLSTGVNMILVAACAGIGLLVGGVPENPALTLLVAGIGLASPVYLSVIAWQPAFLQRLQILRPLFDAGVRGHLAIAAVRLPHLTCLLLGNYICMRMFGIAPPLGDALVRLSLVFVVSVLPISPGGLGTSQMVAVSLLAPFSVAATPAAREAAVFAYSLTIQFGSLILQSILGAIFLNVLARSPVKSGPR